MQRPERIAIGAWMAAASNLILVAAIVCCGGGPVNPIWPLLSSVGLGVGFLYYWPTLLAVVSRAASAECLLPVVPPSMTRTLVAKFPCINSSKRSMT